MRGTALFFFLALAPVGANTWTCISVYLGGKPSLIPPSLNGVDVGAIAHQNATFLPSAYSSQTGTTVWGPTPVTVTGYGYRDVTNTSHFPTYQPAAALSGNNTQYYVLVSSFKPVGNPSAPEQDISIQPNPVILIPTPPCTCYPSDCTNQTAKQQCGSACNVTQCSMPLLSCGMTCYNPSSACGQNGTMQCCNTGSSLQPCCVIGTGGSPILIDTKAEGFHLTGTGDMVRFRSYAADKNTVAMTWTDSQHANAWLVLPVNGQVKGLDQMFGNLMPQPPSATPNGYLALAVYDQPDHGGNGDGRIGPEDRIWSSLRLWKGRPDSAGVSKPEDLYRPELLGVYGFALAYEADTKTDSNGNEFRYKGWVFLDPGRQRKDNRSYDVFLLSTIPR